jgi:hypothetical protein
MVLTRAGEDDYVLRIASIFTDATSLYAATAANPAIATIHMSTPIQRAPFGTSVDVGVALPTAAPERLVAVTSAVAAPPVAVPVGAGAVAVSASA